MIVKKERTLDLYKRAGSEMRLFKSLSADLMADISRVLSASDTDSMIRALRRIDEICSKAEDNMFRDYPNLGADYTNVFYGCVSEEPRNKVDAEIIERARKAADELFR